MEAFPTFSDFGGFHKNRFDHVACSPQHQQQETLVSCSKQHRQHVHFSSICMHLGSTLHAIQSWGMQLGAKQLLLGVYGMHVLFNEMGFWLHA